MQNNIFSNSINLALKQQCDSYFEVQYVSSHICDVFHLHLVFPEMDSLRCITEKIQITAESSCDKTIIYTCKLDNTTLLGFSYSSRAVQLVDLCFPPQTFPWTHGPQKPLFYCLLKSSSGAQTSLHVRQHLS